MQENAMGVFERKQSKTLEGSLVSRQPTGFEKAAVAVHTWPT